MPKADGGQRPLGVTALEDQIVQAALVQGLNAIYEVDLPGFSSGCRPDRSQHDALDALTVGLVRSQVNWVLSIGIRGFFDTLDWSPLRELLPQRVRDGGILRLLGKWLHAGVLEAGVLRHPDKGTPQGGVISPRFAHVCLHYVLDEWFVKDVQTRMQGPGFLSRFADDFIIGRAHEAEARRLRDVLPKRFTRFGSTIHPEKTVLIAFKRPPSRAQSAGGTGTFAFLGFPTIGPKHARDTGSSSGRRAGNACVGLGKRAGHGVVTTALPLSRSSIGREEPEAFIALVRVCGEGAGEPVPLPGT